MSDDPFEGATFVHSPYCDPDCDHVRSAGATVTRLSDVRKAHAAAAAKATTTRTNQRRDRALTGALAVVLDTIEVLRAGGMTDAINGLLTLAELLDAEVKASVQCTSTTHLGPVSRHPSGVTICAHCGTTLTTQIPTFGPSESGQGRNEP